MNRTHIFSNLRSLEEIAFLPEESIRDIQVRKLKSILNYANEYIPFHRERFKAAGFHPQDLESIDDLQVIPPVTREDVIKYHLQMVDERLGEELAKANNSHRGIGAPIPLARFRRNTLIKNASSGTTGSPTVFFDDGSRTALNWSFEFFVKRLYGIEPGSREARMSRVATDYYKHSSSFRSRQILWRQLILPGMNLSESDYSYSWKQIVQYKPNVLFGITSALVGLADFLESANASRQDYKPDLVVTWAAPLHPHEKHLLARVLQCPVTNIYGSREVGHVAALCTEGSFHINQPGHVVESTPSAAQGGSSGTDEILITTLDASPMPFIRYKMGDTGSFLRSKCSCGMNFSRITDITGRTSEVFTTGSGKLLAPNFWARLFMDEPLVSSVSRFQVVYRDRNRATLKVIRNSRYLEHCEPYLRDVLRKNFANNFSVDIEYVNSIDSGPSGKYQLIMDLSGENTIGQYDR